MVGQIVVGLVALLHVGFFVLESVLWTKPTGMRIFGLSAEDAETTRVLASNQGVYNAMLALGLGWAAVSGNREALLFLLVYVFVVGIYGGLTAKPTILALQAAPALVAFGLVWLRW
ncbi:MAG: DUF1304 domain-containing protein [Myxococcales bacterium]|nr:DUF1304 domain-containing protein [Myxococcales bacterium]